MKNVSFVIAAVLLTGATIRVESPAEATTQAVADTHPLSLCDAVYRRAIEDVLAARTADDLGHLYRVTRVLAGDSEQSCRAAAELAEEQWLAIRQ